MLAQQKLMVSLTLVLLAASASAAPLVYAVTGNQQFGAINLATGAFSQIGPDTPEADTGLVAGPMGSLLTLTTSGNLDAINPVTGVTTVIGPTGLADCSTSSSPCGPKSANFLSSLGGTIYATDFQNDLYKINPATGAATLIGLTGVPPVTFIPFGSPNPDGSFNFLGGGLFSAGGNLYETFDTGTKNFKTGAITPVIPDNLYQIDPATGKSTLIAPTAFGLGAVVPLNGTAYGFNNATRQLVTLNLTNGSTTFVSNVDPAAGLIFGAAPSPVPEPGSIGLAALGIAALGVNRLRKRA